MQMHWIRWSAWLVSGMAAMALGLMAPPPAGAQAPVPVGGEFQVNTSTTSGQAWASVASDANGDFVVVWISDVSSGTDTDYSSVQGQRYASNGSPQGAEFQINTYTTNAVGTPSVAADLDGDFVVVWASIGSYGPDQSSVSVQGQRFSSNGSPQGAQFQVNSSSLGAQVQPSVAADADGDFVVVWYSTDPTVGDASGWGVQGQRFASNGTAQGLEFPVNTYTTGNQFLPRVSAEANGDFVVVWQSAGSSGTDSSGHSIQGRRYASNGSVVGGEFQVNSYTTNNQQEPSVASDSDGDFVVVWASLGSFASDTSLSIQHQRYDSNGLAQGGQFQVNSYTTNDQYYPFVAADTDRDFVVVWRSAGSSGTDTSGFSVQGRRFPSSGAPMGGGGQFQVNTFTTNEQLGGSVAAEANGNFVVVWHSIGSSGTDTAFTSVQAQRYSLPVAAPLVPAMSSATRFALAATLMLLGASFALKRRS